MLVRLITAGAAVLLAGSFGPRAEGRADSLALRLTTSESGEGGGPHAMTARAVLIGRGGGQVGIVTISQEGAEVRFGIDIKESALHPGAKGFHIHSVGACEPPDFMSAGDHFNPDGSAHGLGNSAGPHAGDLANLEAEGAYGIVDASLTSSRVTLLPGQPNSLFDADGSSLVVHASYDDYNSQPDGASAERVACGVIEPL